MTLTHEEELVVDIGTPCVLFMFWSVKQDFIILQND